MSQLAVGSGVVSIYWQNCRAGRGGAATAEGRQGGTATAEGRRRGHCPYGGGMVGCSSADDWSITLGEARSTAAKAYKSAIVLPKQL